MTAMRRFLTLFLLCSLALVARAQSAHWESSPDDPSSVQLVFEDCAPDGDPRLPAVADNTLTLAGSSSQTSIINGSFSRSTILTYGVRARRAGATLQIPAFTVETSKGPKLVAAYSGGAARVIADSVANARLTPSTTSVWAGEVFSVTYVLDAARRSFSQLASAIDWNSAPLVIEDWSKPEPAEASVNGEPRLTITYRTRAYAKASGPLALNPATQLVNIATGSIGFGLFQQQRIEQLAVSSRRTDLVVNPLPPAPAGFSGAVGQFRLASKVVPTSAAVGEPITWTLELSGTGNWPDFAGLPSREVSKDFQVVQPQAKRTPAEGKLFDSTLSEDVVLIPTRPGIYSLAPVTFIYFDPQAGAYKTLSTPRTTLTITAAPSANGVAPALKVSLSEPPSSGPAETASAAPALPTPPAAIPRDPLPGATHAAVPFAPSLLQLLLLAPLAAFLLGWAGLALQRAFRDDPRRARREARARLLATLARLRTAGESERAALLLAWQQDAAVLWEVLHAAPPPSSIDDPDWRQLWTEADRALYRAESTLPSDWLARAEAAAAAKRVPGFSPLAALHPRNLAPFFVFILAAHVLVPHLRAEDPIAGAYRRGDFATAERGWSAAVEKNPADPIARHNLSLALAQQDRWDLALAHATAALVQDPASTPNRWQFALAADKAGFIPAPLAAFPHPGPLAELAQLASPGAWQRWLLAAAWAAAFAVGLALYGSYRRPSRLRTVIVLMLLSASGLVAAGSLLARHEYGQTADARAVLVWRGSVLRSIPTEADTTQKTTTLAAGSVAVVDQTFLTWVRLSFDNGQTGWVRRDDVIGLWR